MENIKNKKELADMLPSFVRNNKELKLNDKAVLGLLLFYNGMDKAKEKGSFYATNERIAKEVGISIRTVIRIVYKLKSLNYIKRITGSKNNPSTYIINENTVTNTVEKYSGIYENRVTKYGDKNENRVTKYGDKNENRVTKYSDKIVTEKYGDKTSSIELIINRLDSIENKLNSIELSLKNVTQDKELDINNILIIINNYINNNNLNNIYKKEINNNLLNIKNILKEKENIFINKNKKEKENFLKNKKEIEVIKNIKNEDSALAEHAESNKKEIISISNEENCYGASTIEKLLLENDNILQLRGSYVKLFDVMGNLNSEEELDNTANSIHRWLKQHRDKQVLTQDESREMMFKLSERIHQLRSSIQSKSNTSQETAFSSSQSDLNGKDEQVINEKEKTQENGRKSLEMKLNEMLDKMELTPTMDKLDESYDSISDWLDENGDRLGKYSVRKIERRLNDVYFKHKDKVEYIPIEEVSATVQPNVLS